MYFSGMKKQKRNAGRPYSRLNALPEYESNPFIEKLPELAGIKMNYRRKIGATNYWNEDTGERAKHIETDVFSEITDKEPYAKLFFEAMLPMAKDLKPAALRILIGYFAPQLRKAIDSDVLGFDLNECVRLFDMTKSAVLSAYYELIENGYLGCKSGTDKSKVYFNIGVFYNGDRRKSINDWRKAHSLKPIEKKRVKPQNIFWNESIL